MSHPISYEELKDSLKTEAEIFDEEYNQGDEYIDCIFETIETWFQSTFGTDRIDSMFQYPKNQFQRNRLISICNLLELADNEAWITEDRGLWEGMKGQQVLFAQAFHSAENILREYTKDTRERV